MPRSLPRDSCHTGFKLNHHLAVKPFLILDPDLSCFCCVTSGVCLNLSGHQGCRKLGDDNVCAEFTQGLGQALHLMLGVQSALSGNEFPLGQVPGNTEEMCCSVAPLRSYSGKVSGLRESVGPEFWVKQPRVFKVPTAGEGCDEKRTR